MFFRSRPPPTHPLPLPPGDAGRPRSSSHASPTARSASHGQPHGHPHTHSSASSVFPATSPVMRRDSASIHSASPTSRGQPTPQLLHRSSTSNGPFASLTPTASPSPALSPSPASTTQQQHMLLNSSFSLSTSAASASASASPAQHRPPSPTHYSYHHFSQKMKDPLATTLVKRLKAIVTSITTRPPPSNDQLAATARDLHTQLHSLASQLPAHPLFARTGRAELLNAAESMEKFVLSKLYTTLYWPTNPASSLLQRSRAFYAKCRALSWLHGRHLELPAGKQEAAVWREAGMELRRMAEYKAPKDKLVCLLNACHLIHHTLLSKPAATTTTTTDPEVGADDIFPAFIFALIHAHPRHFLLDLRWVTVGRYPESMKGECEYWVTMAESAIVFIERMNEQSIRVECEGEWEGEMVRAKVRRDEERRRRKEGAVGLDRDSGGSSGGGGVGGSGGKVEEEKRSSEEDDRNTDRSDSDRESDMAAAGNSARLSGTSSNNSSLSADDSASDRQLTVHTDDDLNTSTTSSTSSSLHHTPTTSPTASPLSHTTPLPSPLLLPSAPGPAAGMAGMGAAGCVDGGLMGGLSLSYVGVEACELRGEDVVRLLEEYKEMAAVIKMWSTRGSG